MHNKCMGLYGNLAVVGVAEMSCEDVEDLTVPLEHMSPNTLNFWLSKFVCEVAKQNGERYPPNSLYLLVCAINRHLSDLLINFVKIYRTRLY